MIPHFFCNSFHIWFQFGPNFWLYRVVIFHHAVFAVSLSNLMFSQFLLLGIGILPSWDVLMCYDCWCVGLEPVLNFSFVFYRLFYIHFRCVRLVQLHTYWMSLLSFEKTLILCLDQWIDLYMHLSWWQTIPRAQHDSGAHKSEDDITQIAPGAAHLLVRDWNLRAATGVASTRMAGYNSVNKTLLV